MEDTIMDIADRVMENRTDRPSDYFDEKGLRWCGVCHERKENEYTFFGNKRVLPCLCRCDREAQAERAEQEKQREFERRVQNLKSIGLTEARFRDWRFENDNGCNRKMDMAIKYVTNWKEMQEKNIGYLIMGPVGTGKSFFAGCIANALMEQGVSVMMTNFSRILNELTRPYADKNEIITNLVSYPLLIIDDLGIERNSEFALEMVYNVIDRRYCILKLVTVIMANTKGEGEKEQQDFWYKAEKLLYTALIAYIWYEGDEDEKNFSTLLDLLNESEVREDDEEYKNPVDLLFEELEEKDPEHFAVRQYRKYKLSAGKTAKSILVSCGARLAPFDIAELREIMSYDEMELDMIGDRLTALFLIMSDTDTTFNFVIQVDKEISPQYTPKPTEEVEIVEIDLLEDEDEESEE